MKFVLGTRLHLTSTRSPPYVFPAQQSHVPHVIANTLRSNRKVINRRLITTLAKTISAAPVRYYLCTSPRACSPTKAGGIRVIFQAMQRLVGNAEVQVKGADMLKTLISEDTQVRRSMPYHVPKNHRLFYFVAGVMRWSKARGGRNGV